MNLSAVLRELIAAGLTGEELIQAVERIEASNRSKSSGAERTRRWRENKAAREAEQSVTCDVTPSRNVTEPLSSPNPPLMVSPITPSLTTPLTPPIPNSRAVAQATRPKAPLEEIFLRFKGEYPRRDGANPWQPARKALEAAIRAGADPEEIIAAASRYSAEMQAKGQFGTSFVAQAVTWLRQQRWKDYPPELQTTKADEPPPGAPSDEELRKLYAPKRQPETSPESGNILPAGSGGHERPGSQSREGRHTSEGLSAPDIEPGYAGVPGLGRILSQAGLDTNSLSMGGRGRSTSLDGPGEMAPVVRCFASDRGRVGEAA